MIKYVFRDDDMVPLKSAKNVNPQVIGEALQRIADKDNGRLTPGAVVDAATPKSHPLHNHFEWDDATAASAFRLDQARALIRLVRVEDDTSAEPPRAFLSAKDGDKICYHSFQAVMQSASLQLAVMNSAKRDLEAFKRRYRGLQDIFPELNTAIAKIDSRIIKNESSAHIAA